MLDSVLAYINNHLEETITLEELAKVTGYSPYYLHRRLKEELHEPIGNFIIRQRIQSASYLLAFTELPVAEIRLLVGYENDSAFSRAFKSLKGVSPREFRKQQSVKTTNLEVGQYVSLKYEIVRLSEQKAVLFPCIGNYFSKDIYNVWEKAGSFIQDEGLVAEDFTYFGVLRDCQKVNTESLCRYDAAIIIKPNISLPVNKNFISALPGGKFVKYKFCCPIKDYLHVGTLINEHIASEPKLKHREGISYFQFQTLPTLESLDNLFIEWYIPVY